MVCALATKKVGLSGGNAAWKVREADMQFEYLRVAYSTAQTVCANAASVGMTNEILELAPGDYTISLSGVTTDPPSVDISLYGTTPDQPQEVAFT
jgi:hypothetical protein